MNLFGKNKPEDKPEDNLHPWQQIPGRSSREEKLPGLENLGSEGGYSPGELEVMRSYQKHAISEFIDKKSGAALPDRGTDDGHYQMSWEEWQHRVTATSYERLGQILNELQVWMDLVLDEFNSGKRSKDASHLMIVIFTRQKEYIERVMKKDVDRDIALLTRKF